MTGPATVGPYAWHPHLGAWIVLAAVGIGIVAGHRRQVARWARAGEHRTSGAGATPPPAPWTRRQKAALAGAWLAAAVALTWPLADLAAHWSVTALVVQRLLLVLAVPPLALLGFPYGVLAALTRPAAVDTILHRCRQPAVAVAVFTAATIGAMTVPAVAAQSTSAAARGAFDAAVLGAGIVLWVPVVGRVPGVLRLRPVGRFGYLAFQAVVPAFLAFIYIFARHPIYPTLAHSHPAIGLAPLNDQQLAGFVSKLGMLVTLLAVAAWILRTGLHADELGADEPLVWADVERQFERADRRRARAGPERSGLAWAGPAAGQGGGDEGDGTSSRGDAGRAGPQDR